MEETEARSVSRPPPGRSRAGHKRTPEAQACRTCQELGQRVSTLEAAVEATRAAFELRVGELGEQMEKSLEKGRQQQEALFGKLTKMMEPLERLTIPKEKLDGAKNAGGLGGGGAVRQVPCTSRPGATG